MLRKLNLKNKIKMKGKKTIDQLVNEQIAQNMLDNPEEFILQEDDLDYTYEDMEDYDG